MKSDDVYLEHILEAIKSIEMYIAENELSGFLANEMMQGAVIRKLEIIGEAARNISLKTRSKIRGVQWAAIAGMRNRLIHAYFDVNLMLVWETAKKDLPKLKKTIREYLK